MAVCGGAIIENVEPQDGFLRGQNAETQRPV
jgi:hypothetical protein